MHPLCARLSESSAHRSAHGRAGSWSSGVIGCPGWLMSASGCSAASRPTVDGVAVPDPAWRLKKARELVKLLALARGHRLHREQAMDVLWRDLAPAAAANNLHQAVHVARRALGADAIDVRDEVPLAHGATSTSTARAARPRTRGGSKTAAAYRAALALYGGELLPENRYDDWAEARREELATLAAELAEESAALGSTTPFGLPGRCELVRRPRPRARRAGVAAPPHTRCSRLSGAGGAGKTRLALELARGAEPAYEAGAALVELAAARRPTARPGRDRDRARRQRRCRRRSSSTAVIDFLAARDAAARARQLRARAGGDRRALGRAAPRGAAADDRRDEPRAAARRPARSSSASPRSRSPTPSSPLPPAASCSSTRRSRSSSTRAAAAAPGFALDERERRGRRAHLPPPRRAAARARARSGAARRAEPGGDRGSARRPVPPPAQRAATPRRPGSRR